MIPNIFKRLAALSAVLALLTVTETSAQTLTDGSLKGVVRDGRGLPVGEVVLTLRDRATGVTTSVPVTRSGVFSLALLAPGSYDLTAEAFGLRPLRIEGIQVLAGSATHVNAQLTRSEDPNTPIEVRRFSGGAVLGTQRIGANDLERFPFAGRELGNVARLSTVSTADLETEGLPGRLSGIHVDGFAVSALALAGRALPALPLSSIRQAEILNSGADVEWSGAAAPVLSVQSLAPSSRLEVRTFGDWLKGPARTADLATPEFKGLQAGALVSGPFVRDTAGFVLGLEFWRLDSPIALNARVDSTLVRAANVARDVYGADPALYTLDRLSERKAVSAFGRLDWQLGAVHGLRVNAAFTTQPEARGLPALLDRVGSQSRQSAADGYLSATVTSTLSDALSQEFRLGFDRTQRDYANADAATEAATAFVQDGFSFGRDPALTGKFATSTLRLRETVHLRGAEHHVKLGLSAELASHDFTYNSGTRSFWFSSTDDFASGTGYGVFTQGAATASFKAMRFGGFLQDEWSVDSRFRLLLGARLDLDAPDPDVRLNADWLRLTGLRADSALERKVRFSPRVEFEWRPQEGWALRGSGGIWDGAPDPLLIGEIAAFDGPVSVVRGFGTFADWPQTGAAAGRPTLTLPAAAFQGPLSRRANLQVSRSLGPAAVTLGATYRRTERLPRRTDLNRAASAGIQDQYGRDLYGTLQQRGGLLAATTGSNRRFSEFDVVSALDVDGWSDYRGFDVALSAPLIKGLEIQGRYTFSSTKDNWFMARDAGVAAPAPLGDGDEWTEGVSDFDVPHRAMAGAELTLPLLGGLRVAALYRFSSGYPFTPGFHTGVDANGDGVLNNDPAYVDAQISGFNDLAARWPCLSSQAGAFAQRNSCRAESQRALDARVAFSVFNSNGRKAELVVDALNLINSGGAEVDRALYLVDAARTLVVNPSNGQVSVPLLINPHFGAPLLRASAARTLRVGLRLSY